MDSMISSLIGGALGFGASVAPEIMTLIREARQHKYTMEQKRLELEAAKENYSFELDKSRLSAGTEELKALLAHDATLKGTPFIENLRASVRPVITYLFLLLFIVVKIATLFRTLFYQDVPVLQAIPLLWDSETVGLFSAVLSFWFGSRAMDTYRLSRRARTK